MGRVPADAPERRRIRARTALALSRRVCRSTHPATHMTEVRHRPTGTVVIPCFNQARFLPAAVASVHRQSYPGPRMHCRERWVHRRHGRRRVEARGPRLQSVEPRRVGGAQCRARGCPRGPRRVSRRRRRAAARRRRAWRAGARIGPGTGGGRRTMPGHGRCGTSSGRHPRSR